MESKDAEKSKKRRGRKRVGCVKADVNVLQQLEDEIVVVPFREVKEILDKRSTGGPASYRVLLLNGESVWVYGSSLPQDLLEAFDQKDRSSRYASRRGGEDMAKYAAGVPRATKTRRRKLEAPSSSTTAVKAFTDAVVSPDDSETPAPVVLPAFPAEFAELVEAARNSPAPAAPTLEKAEAEAEADPSEKTADSSGLLDEVLTAISSSDSDSFLDSLWQYGPNDVSIAVPDMPAHMQPVKIVKLAMNGNGVPFVQMQWNDGHEMGVTFPAAVKYYPRIFVPWLEDYTATMAKQSGCSVGELLAAADSIDNLEKLVGKSRKKSAGN